MATTSTSKTGSFTSKSKIELGVPEDKSVIWVPFDLTSEERELLGNWNSQLCIDEQVGKDDKKIVDPANYPMVDAEEYRKPYQRLRRTMHKWLADSKTEITEVAEKFATIVELTPEQLQKKIQSTQASLDRMAKMMEQMEAMKAKAATEAATTEEKASK